MSATSAQRASETTVGPGRPGVQGDVEELTIVWKGPLRVVHCELGKDLKGANDAVAVEADSPDNMDLLHLNPGQCFLASIKFKMRFWTHERALLPEHESLWNPNFPGYHSCGHRSSVAERQYLNAHGGKVLSLSLLPAEAASLVQTGPRPFCTQFFNKRSGTATSPMPWGAWFLKIEDDVVYDVTA